MSTHHISNIKKGDTIYAVHTADDGKESKHVVRVTKVLESSILGNEVKTAHYRAGHIEIQKSDICFNLGPGEHDFKLADTTLSEDFTRHTTEHEFFGRINWSFVPEEAVEKQVMKAYNLTAKFLKANALEGIRDLPVVQEVYHKAKKYAGYYKSSKNLGKAPGFMRFSPTHKTLESISASSYVVAHEVGHIIDIQVLAKRPKLKAKWLELYHETVSPVYADKDTLKELLESLKASENLSAFRAQVKSDEEKLEIVKAIFDYLKRAHGLSAFDVDVILLAEDPAKLDQYWPRSSSCFTRSLKPSVSQYATENVKELFAESFAFYVAGMKLPKAVKDLMEESLQRAAKSLPILLKEIEDSRSGNGDDNE